MALHTKIDGQQAAYNRPSTIKVEPFNIIGVETTDLTIGLVEVALSLTVATNPGFLHIMRNISTAGQSIRIGSAGLVTFGPPGQGLLLYPGESLELYNVGYDWSAIADAAGGLLNIRGVQTLF